MTEAEGEQLRRRADQLEAEVADLRTRLAHHEARTRDEPRVRRARDDLQVIIDALPALISYIDRNGIYRFNNRYYETWFDEPLAVLTGRSVEAVLGPEAYAYRVPYIERALGGEDVIFDALMPYRGGALRQSEIRYIPRRTPDGTVDGFFVMVTDLTERERDKAALQDAESRLRLALQAADMGIYDRDLEAEALTWDARLKAMFGLPADAAVSYAGAFLDSLHPEDRARVDRAMDEAVRTDTPLDVDFRIVRVDDRAERVLALRGAPVLVQGRATRFVGAVRDVTDARAAEAKANRLARLVEQSSDFIGVIDIDGRSDFLNDAGRRLVGLRDLDDVRSRDFSSYFAPETGATFREIVLPAVRKTGFWQGDLEFRNFSTGTAVPVHYTIFPIRDHADAVVGYGTVTRDLTERRRAEAFRTALIEFGDRLQNCDGPEMAVVGPEIMARTLGLDRVSYGTLDAALGHVDIERDWTAPGVATIAGRHPISAYVFDRSALARGREIVIADVEKDPRSAPSAQRLAELGIRALLNVPVLEQGRPVAVFFLHDRQVHDWRPDKLAFIREIAERTHAAVQRARAVTARQASEAELRLVADALPVLVAFIDRTLTYRFVNAAGRHWFGRDPADTVGRTMGEVLGDAGLAQRMPYILKALDGHTMAFDLDWPSTDGRRRRAGLCFTPRRDAHDVVDGFYIFVQDVTVQRDAETLLATRAETLEREVAARTAERNRLWETTSDLMATAGLDGFLKTINPAWTSMLGWSEAELLSRPLADLIAPTDRAANAGMIDRLRSGETVASVIGRLETKIGAPRVVMWTAVPDPGTQLVHMIGRDLTEQRQMEEALRQSQKMEAVGQLTGGLAHDFNNLLTGISGSLELLATRISQGRLIDLDRYINAAQGASRRAAALTHRLLAFSRRQTLDPKPTEVNALIAGMEELVRRTVGPAIDVEVVGATGLWTALVDANQLENALLNLCINARDAMPTGGRITIETANKWMDDRAARERDLSPGQYLSLCVSDTGTGMTPDVIAHAFDPFFTTKPIGEGTGLGLSMIYGFARQSGGQVRIYSEVGQGTTMCIYLPRHYGPADPGETAPDLATAPRAGENETVLVVDDEPTVRMLVAEVLADLGYTAIEAADGPSGLKVLRSDVRIDLLVTDVGLPGGMNGRQMADAARVTRPGLKVLFITGYAENAAVGNGHLDPGMQVLTKPFVMETLAHRIKDLINAR